ncbi:hypothetical protein ScPMuIL_008465 [Solemya velum]
MFDWWDNKTVSACLIEISIREIMASLPLRLVYIALLLDLYCTFGLACIYDENQSTYICRKNDSFPVSVPTGVQVVKLYEVSVPTRGAFLNHTWSDIAEIHVESNIQLELRGNQLEGLFSLKAFHWRHGQLKNISLLDFSYVPLLEVLDLTGNSYLTLSSVTNALNISPLENLRVLRSKDIQRKATGNYGTLSESFYRALFSTKLEVVDISESGIYHAAPGIHNYLRFLRSIDISSTTVIGDVQAVIDLINITTLENVIANGIFPSIGAPVKPGIQIITNASLKGNMKRVITKVCLSNLKSLSLNNLKFFLPYIYRGDVSICEGYNVSWALEKLWLENNNLKEVNLTLRCNSRLELLSLANNILEYISPRFFRFLLALKHINLSGNNLWKMSNNDEFAYLFQYNEQLEYIDLSDNGLEVLHRTMFENKLLLKQLILRDNNLHDVDIRLPNTHSLELLDLSQNSISFISANTRADLERQSIYNASRHYSSSRLLVNLTNNDLICSCGFKKFLEWLLTTNITVKHGENYTCLYNGKSVPVPDDIATLVSEKCHDEETDYEAVTIYIVVSVVSVFIAAISIFSVTRSCKSRRWRDKIQQLRVQVENNLPKNSHTERFLAFITYSHVDKDFVMRTFYPTLKKKLLDALNITEMSDVVCINDKEFTPGYPIDQEVVRCVDSSDVTILLISSASVESRWSQFETYVAHEFGKPIFLIFLEHVNIGLLPMVVRRHFMKKISIREIMASLPLRLVYIALLLDLYCTFGLACIYDENQSTYICRKNDSFPVSVPTGVQVVKLYEVSVPTRGAFLNHTWSDIAEIHVESNIRLELRGNQLEGLFSLKAFHWRHGQLKNISLLDFSYVPLLEVLDLTGNSYLTLSSVTNALNISPLENLRVLRSKDIQRKATGNYGTLSESFYRALFSTKLEVVDISESGIYHAAPGIHNYLRFLRSIDISSTTVVGDIQAVIDLINITTLENVIANGIFPSIGAPVKPGIQIITNASLKGNMKRVITKKFLEWLLTTNITVKHGENYTCLYNGKSVPVPDDIATLVSEKCHDEETDYEAVTIYIVVSVVSVFIAAISIFSVTRSCKSRRWRDKIQQLRVQVENNLPKNSHTERFLAFIAYSHVDKDFVLRTFYPTLKKKLLDALNITEMSDVVCINDKEFTPGYPIDQEVVRCVDSSDVTILLISSASVESRWSQFETYVAHEFGKPIFLIFLEHVNIGLLPMVVRRHFMKKVRLVWPLNGCNEAVDMFWKSLCKEIVRHSKTNVSRHVDLS